MSGRSAFSIKIDTEQLLRFAERLALSTPEQLGHSIVSVLNQTTDNAYELGRKRILNGINLDDVYVKRKMKVEHATEKKPEASIVAFGGKGFITSLSHYGAMQETRRVNWTNARILAAGKRFGPWPGWTKRTGNEGIGIAPDTKAAGRSVEVVRGRRKVIGPTFSIKGKKDAEGNLVVFRRKAGSQSIEALTGPSVYQLFRVAATAIEGQVADDLEQAIIAAAERQLRENLR